MFRKILNHLLTKFFWINLLILIFVALLAGHFIVTHDRDETLVEFLKLPYYYSSVAYSATIALLLLLWIYAVGVYLQNRFQGNVMNSQWVLLQFIYGVLAALLIELLLATVLFYYHGFWIVDTAFFKKLWGPVVMFVMIVNLCYLIFYLWRVKPVKVTVDFKPRSNRIIGTDSDEFGEIALVYLQDGVTWVYDFDGNNRVVDQTLDSILQGLAQGYYFRGNRHWAIHFDAIEKVEPVSAKSYLILLPFDFENELLVARRRIADFKAWNVKMLET